MRPFAGRVPLIAHGILPNAQYTTRTTHAAQTGLRDKKSRFIKDVKYYNYPEPKDFEVAVDKPTLTPTPTPTPTLA